ncbi:MAG: hypothetical protein KIT02_03110 [Devosia sp.]|uniref:hypothetical protein n=1 Tax=Devosia sp. TaxID=1871048 RepID=UPI0024C7DFFF|nr:hypothetical protein [Devosia sp.]UYO00230.1 MAG: hypothetical protein KIT02_03110 [Devosia sp.]
MNVSWETVAVIQAAHANLRDAVDDGQAIVDRKNRQLHRANGRIASLEAEVAALRRERTSRGMRILAAAAIRHVH